MSDSQEMAGAVRDQALAWLTHHRETCADPDLCMEPIGFIAFLCHSLGLHSGRLDDLRLMLERLESSCPACSHLRN